MEWIKTEIQLPPISETDGWAEEHRQSDKVLCYSEWGCKFAHYYYEISTWKIEGVGSTQEIIVTHWAKLEPPKN